MAVAMVIFGAPARGQGLRPLDPASCNKVGTRRHRSGPTQRVSRGTSTRPRLLAAVLRRSTEAPPAQASGKELLELNIGPHTRIKPYQVT